MRDRKLLYVRESGRDFLLALAVFTVLFAAMTVGHDIADPVAFLALAIAGFVSEFPTIVTGMPSLTGQLPQFGDVLNSLPSLTSTGLSRLAAPTAAAILFATITSFSLVFVRHLRRVHASSRRGAWRENSTSLF
ncbi:MAG: hypothetical protein ACR2PA_21425 [Hyphomicrobiaceae bacterium]